MLATLREHQRDQIAHGTLSFDGLVADYIRAHLTYRFIVTDSAANALDIERRVQASGLAGSLPLLNPAKALRHR